jgi:glycerol-3-phosphate dehydrogenase subunit B
MTHVVVVGAGAAGTAAAFQARKLGARVTLVAGAAGATALASGALDDPGRSGANDEDRAVAPFLDALGAWVVTGQACRVATASGVLREARGRDRGVLDLAMLEPGTVAVIDVFRRGWDARGLARCWDGDPWAAGRGLRFEAIAAPVLRRVEEAEIPLVDLAARHDDPERVRWLVDRIRESPELAGARALIVGPWLGVRRAVAEELSRAVGKPIGEPLSPPGAAAGMRFELARDALLSKLEIERVDDWAARVEVEGSGVQAQLASGGFVRGAAVVLALGGLVGGGLEWSPVTAPSGFTASATQPGSIARGDAPLRSSGSPEGALFQEYAWGPGPVGFERVGIWTDREHRVRAESGSPVHRFYAAGDVIADAPRTVMRAVRDGLAAGARAARDALGDRATSSG